MTEPVEEPLGDVAVEKKIEVVARSANPLLEPFKHRRRNVDRRPLRHWSDSRYGRMTLAARSRPAHRERSSTVARCRR